MALETVGEVSMGVTMCGSGSIEPDPLMIGNGVVGSVVGAVGPAVLMTLLMSSCWWAVGRYWVPLVLGLKLMVC